MSGFNSGSRTIDWQYDRNHRQQRANDHLIAEARKDMDIQADTEVNAMRIVCLAAVQWKLAADAVSDFDKNAYTPLPDVLASTIVELREESQKRTRLVEARLKAQVVFWEAVNTLGWHNQERNRPCPRP